MGNLFSTYHLAVYLDFSSSFDRMLYMGLLSMLASAGRNFISQRQYLGLES